MDKRAFTTALATYVVNPIVRALVERGLAPPSYAILETTGRKTGPVDQSPVRLRVRSGRTDVGNS